MLIPTVLYTEQTYLVPYYKQYVQKYHEWMQDEALRIATKSELLTLQEEHEMQQKWSTDADKITFLIFEHHVMIGDVNLFKVPDFEVDKLVQEYYQPTGTYGELEIMIAESSFRHRGHAKRALQMMMYMASTQGYTHFIARIDQSNGDSIKLFDSLNFISVYNCPIFNEHVLICTSTPRKPQEMSHDDFHTCIQHKQGKTP